MENYFRLISNQVRFAYGYKMIDGKKVFYAWHGTPSRNDDYIITSEITESEFYQIEQEYPNQIIADRETAEIFKKKYIDNHKILRKGWNVSI